MTSADLGAPQLGPCAESGGSVCFCAVAQLKTRERTETSIGAGTHEFRIEFLITDPAATMDVQWAVGDIGRRQLDLTVPEVHIDQEPEGNGQWGDLKDCPLIAIHTTVQENGRALTFGGDENGLANGRLKIDV